MNNTHYEKQFFFICAWASLPFGLSYTSELCYPLFNMIVQLFYHLSNFFSIPFSFVHSTPATLVPCYPLNKPDSSFTELFFLFFPIYSYMHTMFVSFLPPSPLTPPFPPLPPTPSLPGRNCFAHISNFVEGRV
jgi:hypothetical protein